MEFSLLTGQQPLRKQSPLSHGLTACCKCIGSEVLVLEADYKCSFFFFITSIGVLFLFSEEIAKYIQIVIVMCPLPSMVAILP